jgi:type I restriction-modification system DNA methylase subunit
MELQQKFINHLGFSEEIKNSSYGELFEHRKELSGTNKFFKITYLFYNSENSLFEYHLSEWNKNELDFFIAVGEKNSYIIKAKEKADRKEILSSNIVIKDFKYGTTTANYENIVPSDIPFTREKIDNSVFFDFVLRKVKDIKNEIDTHLLNNLIALKEEISKFDTINENINGLILKSLFIKYFEDRNILSNISFIDTLKTHNPENLRNTFGEIATINGDILKQDLNITEKHIRELEIFFTEDYKEYKTSGQQYIKGFYPYRFDIIPIQLISNIYEEFLGKTEKKTKGIFYTRTFVVDFMLSHSIYPKIEKNSKVTILDPACGSGAFLVQAFKKILETQTQKEEKLSIDEKAKILKKQIFGVDIDAKALQITAFSLYLTLLAGISKEEIQKQIAIRKPILPSLLGSNLLQKNTITDDIVFDFIIETTGEHVNQSKFDCIAANPPWKELKLSDEKDDYIKKSREIIHKSSLYKNVNKYQTSQAFLLKINEFCHKDTDVAIIVNNSNFLNVGDKKNDKPIKFRTEILEKYRLEYFYELSNVAPILFKGTEHPCVVLILNKQISKNHTIKYITPILTDFNKKLRLISYTSKDLKEVKQNELLEEDILWRIFVNGDWKDYQLIKKLELKKCNKLKVIFCGRGINPNNATPKNGEPEIKNMLDAGQLTKFYICRVEKFNVNQIFERERVDKENLFKGKRILLRRTPSPKDELKLSSVYVEDELYFKEQIISLKLNIPELHKPYCALLNSSLIGFYLNQTSSQTNKGKKMTAIRHQELIQLPLFKFTENELNILVRIYDEIGNSIKTNSETKFLFTELDELVFDLYGLLEFEKEIIREFYQINVERKNEKVSPKDLENYAAKFRDVYQSMIKQNLRLNASFVPSLNIGTVVKFSIVEEKEYEPELKKGNYTQKQILQLVKKYQIEQELFSGYINEEKVKIYDGKSFYIIKSNQFKDWTTRQAMEDAREEIHEMLKKLM